MRAYALGWRGWCSSNGDDGPATVSSADRPEIADPRRRLLWKTKTNRFAPASIVVWRRFPPKPDDRPGVYVAERRAKIDNRRRLAQIFGFSESALRNRVQRVRDRLERCVQGVHNGCRGDRNRGRLTATCRCEAIR